MNKIKAAAKRVDVWTFCFGPEYLLREVDRNAEKIISRTSRGSVIIIIIDLKRDSLEPDVTSCSRSNGMINASRGTGFILVLPVPS